MRILPDDDQEWRAQQRVRQQPALSVSDKRPGRRSGSKGVRFGVIRHRDKQEGVGISKIASASSLARVDFPVPGAPANMNDPTGFECRILPSCGQPTTNASIAESHPKTRDFKRSFQVLFPCGKGHVQEVPGQVRNRGQHMDDIIAPTRVRPPAHARR